MIKDKIGNNNRNKKKNNKKTKLVALTGTTIAITLLIASIAAIGTAPFSVQQQEGQGPEQERTPGPTITSGNIVDDTIVSADLKDGEAVRSEDIVDGQVSNEDLADDAVTTDKIADGEVTSDDLAPGTIPSSGVPNMQIVEGNIINVRPNSGAFGTADCPDGTILTGGGYEEQVGSSESEIDVSRPLSDNRWQIRLSNSHDTLLAAATPYAVCVGPTP